jgi:amyotrophic lateral sclerosis 2 protein
LQASLVKYPLKLVWLAAIASKRHALEIITPEETFVVRCPTQEQIQIWFDSLSKAIADTLTPNELDRRGYRSTDFEFSAKHPKYPCGKYCGEWLNGKLHGIGFLILPTPQCATTHVQSGIFDGHIYNGQFVDNAIKGYGTMDEYAVGDKVSSYFGDFEDGKFSGYGEIQNFKNGDTYKGFFKNGLAHGFGEMATTTYTYVGEFLNNLKSGYGVLDYRLNAEKYMGMFLLGKKNGAGFLVKEGDYFEGVFVNDILAEHGLAIFQNGSYFIGDLTLYGPKGRGTFYFCGREIVDEQVSIIQAF